MSKNTKGLFTVEYIKNRFNAFRSPQADSYMVVMREETPLSATLSQEYNSLQVIRLTDEQLNNSAFLGNKLGVYKDQNSSRAIQSIHSLSAGNFESSVVKFAKSPF